MYSWELTNATWGAPEPVPPVDVAVAVVVEVGVFVGAEPEVSTPDTVEPELSALEPVELEPPVADSEVTELPVAPVEPSASDVLVVPPESVATPDPGVSVESAPALPPVPPEASSGSIHSGVGSMHPETSAASASALRNDPTLPS